MFEYNLLTEISVVFIILLSGLIIGRLSGKIIRYIFINLKYRKIKIHRLAQNLVRYSVYLFSIYLVILRLNIEQFLISILYMLGIFLLLIYSFIKIVDFIINISAWFYVNSKLKKGSQLNLLGIRGIVQKINLTETKVLKDNEIILLPNIFIKKAIQDN